MSTEASETKNEQTAKQAPTEQQESKAGVPKRFAVGQTVCNEKNEKGKLCNGHLKERNTAHPAKMHLRGDDALHQCQTCGALYMGPPLGHVRDSRKQSRYVERDLAAILRAAGGTLPAYTYPVPEWRRASLPQQAPPATKATTSTHAETQAPSPPAPAATPKPAPAARAEARPAATDSPTTATAPPAPSAAPEGETPQQKRARIVAELNAKYAGKTAPPRKKKTDAETAAAAPSGASARTPTSEAAPVADSSTPAVDSSAEADRHRPAAEAQAATGQASAAPLSPAAATASPAAGAETVADLAPEASTELTPGAPKADAPPAAEAAPEKRKAAGQRNRGPRELPPHLRPPEGETHEEKIARLTAFVEEAKRKAGKL